MDTRSTPQPLTRPFAPSSRSSRGNGVSTGAGGNPSPSGFFRIQDGVALFQGCALDHLRRMSDESANCFVTSPPYGIGKSYEIRQTLESYQQWMDLIMAEACRVLVSGGSIFWQSGFHVADGELAPLDALAWQSFRRLGLKCRNRIVWTFGHGAHSSRRFSGRHESILWFTKGDDYRFDLDAVRVPQKWPNKRAYKGPRIGELSCNPLGKNPGDVWEICNVKSGHPEKTEHPCQFPEELVRRLVLATTQPGDFVVDPFAGSGTVGKVAMDTGRHALLIEKDESFVSIIEKRLWPEDELGLTAQQTSREGEECK